MIIWFLLFLVNYGRINSIGLRFILCAAMTVETVIVLERVDHCDPLVVLRLSIVFVMPSSSGTLCLTGHGGDLYKTIALIKRAGLKLWKSRPLRHWESGSH